MTEHRHTHMVSPEPLQSWRGIKKTGNLSGQLFLVILAGAASFLKPCGLRFLSLAGCACRSSRPAGLCMQRGVKRVNEVRSDRKLARPLMGDRAAAPLPPPTARAPLPSIQPNASTLRLAHTLSACVAEITEPCASSSRSCASTAPSLESTFSGRTLASCSLMRSRRRTRSARSWRTR